MITVTRGIFYLISEVDTRIEEKHAKTCINKKVIHRILK